MLNNNSITKTFSNLSSQYNNTKYEWFSQAHELNSTRHDYGFSKCFGRGKSVWEGGLHKIKVFFFVII